MGTPNGLRPARLKVGIVSAGRVGTAVGMALERADHVVVACSAISAASLRLAGRRLPDTPVLPVPEVAAHAELLLLTVPDSELPGLVTGLAATGAVRRGTIVAHTSGANGVAVLAPLTDQGCVPLAIHPAMTFTGADEDVARLADTCFGITAADIGITPNSGGSFSFFSTYISETAYRSAETFGASYTGSPAAGWNSFDAAGSNTFTLVPEPTTCGFLTAAAVALAARVARRRTRRFVIGNRQRSTGSLTQENIGHTT